MRERDRGRDEEEGRGASEVSSTSSEKMRDEVRKGRTVLQRTRFPVCVEERCEGSARPPRASRGERGRGEVRTHPVRRRVLRHVPEQLAVRLLAFIADRLRAVHQPAAAREEFPERESVEVNLRRSTAGRPVRTPHALRAAGTYSDMVRAYVRLAEYALEVHRRSYSLSTSARRWAATVRARPSAPFSSSLLYRTCDGRVAPVQHRLGRARHN